MKQGTQSLCSENLEGWRAGEGGGRFVMEGTHVYLWLIHTDIRQKPPQYSNYPPIKHLKKLEKKLAAELKKKKKKKFKEVS